jgi:hypothetical protein
MSRLITVSYLKEFASIDNNVQSKQIEIAIDHAQDIYLQQILGTTLLNKLKADNPTFTGEYQTLINDYIKPYLLYRVMVDLLPKIHYQVRNKGVVEMISSDSNTADFKAFKFLLDDYTNKSQFAASRIIDFLCNKQNEIPEYTAPNEAGDVRPNAVSFISDLSPFTNRNANPYSSLKVNRR